MTDALSRYLHDSSVGEIILVRSISGADGELTLYRKCTDFWEKVLCCPALLGRDGTGKSREGDMKTPVGDFGIICAFGIKDNPGAGIEYLHVDESLYCCSAEGPDYNRFVHYPCEGEHMLDFVPEYNYGFFPDYNREGVYPAGSAVFFHVRGAKPYTSGCVAVEEEAMKRILRELSPGARVIIEGPGPQAI